MDQMFRMLADSCQSRRPPNPMDVLIAYEREETDRAIAVALQEEEQEVSYDEAQLAEDEEFAVALSLDTESPTGYKDELTYRSYPSHMSSGQRFQLSENEDDIIAQLEEDCESSRMQWTEDEERFQLNEIGKVIAQLEEDEKRRKMQLMEDEELAVAIMAQSLAETGKEDISWPDASLVSPGRGFALPECENVSISQLEDVERRRSSQFMEDEQLAIALEETLKVESPDQLKRICAGCNSFGHGQFLNRMDTFWHSECFRCHECSLEIVGEEFSRLEDKPYHSTCYEELTHPKCEVCKISIPPDAKWHRFWMRKFCPSHEEDGTPQCCGCERLEPKDMKYFSLDDGRKLCMECLESAIMDATECKPLYREIQEFFEGLDMKLEQHIPLDLVKQQTLNDAKEQKKGNHDLPETRGLTLVEENEVLAIYVLKGLPRLLLGNILAHEMMHSWLRLKGCDDLSPIVEEGICQVMAHRWLENEIDKNTTFNSIASSSASSSSSSSESTSWKKGIWTDIQRKLAECFRNQIETDVCPIYGKGFELAKRAVLDYGLKATLSHIQMKRSLPS